MLEGDPIQELTSAWLRQAIQDLSACRALVGIVDEVRSPIGFHVQQAIEKALKAVLVSEQIDFSRTHYLVALVRRHLTARMFLRTVGT